VSGGADSAEKVLDDLLATLQASDLGPLELRILLQLAERDASPTNLTDALDTEPKPIGSAIRRLAMRGLIRRRFAERGRDSHVVVSVRSAGLLELVPLLERNSGAQDRTLRRPVAGVGCPRDDHERRTRRAQESARDAAEKDGAQRAVSARTEHKHAHLPGRAAQRVLGASVQ